MRRRWFVLLIPALLSAADPERRARQEFEQLAARANTQLGAVRAMEERLRALGLELHPDIAEARTLAESAMDAVEESIRAGEWKQAHERVAKARAFLDKLKRKF